MAAKEMEPNLGPAFLQGFALLESLLEGEGAEGGEGGQGGQTLALTRLPVWEGHS